MLTPRTHVNRHQRGNALVEFAFVLPLLLSLIFGAITFSAAMYNKVMLINASREAARSGVIYQTTRPTSTTVANTAQQYCASNLLNFGLLAAGCTATVTMPASPVSGDNLTVKTTQSFTGLYVFGSFSISAQTTMRYE